MPQIWTTSSAGFLESLALDLSPAFPDLQSVGLGLLGTLLVTAGWSEETRRAFSKEALANGRHTLKAELQQVGDFTYMAFDYAVYRWVYRSVQCIEYLPFP